MKKLVVLAVLIFALSASVAMAAGPSVSANWAVDLSAPLMTKTNFVFTGITAGWYELSWSGSWSIDGDSFNTQARTINGAIDATANSQVVHSAPPISNLLATDYLYKYFYRATGSGIWTEVGAFYPGQVYNGTGAGGSGKNAISGAVNIDGIAVEYGVYAEPTSHYNASGQANLVARAVPEASTLVGFGSALAMAGPGLVGWLRRRRA